MNMTPMIDVVFLLLIFFMTVSQVSEVNKAALELPKLKGSEDQRRTTITVNVTQEGTLLVSGETMSIARLIVLVADEIARLGGDPSRLTVVIRADERGESGGVNDVVNALSRMGIRRVRIAVQTPQ